MNRPTPTQSFILRNLLCGCLITMLCFFSVTVGAQATLPFNNYSVNDGLPSSEVYHAMQDSKGFMWFSTDHGVCRYDGYQFKTFTTADGLADNTIFECIEDYKGRIWFRSFSGRLSYYYHDSIFRYAENDKLISVLHQGHVSSISIDTADNVYIASQLLQGIIRINLRHKNSIKMLSVQQKITYLLSVPGANSPIMGNTLGTPAISMDTTSFLVMYTISTNDSVPQKQFNIYIANNDELPLLWYSQAIKTPDGEIVFCYGKKMIILKNGKIVYTHFFNSYITKLNVDGSGRIWVALQNDLPVCIIHHKILPVPVLKVLKDKLITSITLDNEGGLWLTSLTNGIYYLSSLDFSTRTTEDGLLGNKVAHLEMAPDSSLWVCTSPGNTITVISKDTVTYKTIKNFNNSTTVNSVLFNIDSSVWVGSGNTLRIFNNPHDFKVLKPKFAHGEKDMVQRKDGSVWINCTGDVRLCKQIADSLQLLDHININVTIKKLLVKPNNTLWLATMNGLWEYKNDSLINWGKKYPVLNKRIDDIKLSPGGDLWMATRDTGLIIKNNDKLNYININNGLVSNFSQCLYFDYKGNLWVGTNAGLSHIIMHYDRNGICIIDSIKNIASSNLREINCVTCIKNMVYAGTNNGLVSFDMNKMDINRTQPPVYITGLKINNKNIPISPKKFNLDYDENNIVINYVGLTYRDAENTIYRYKMQGVDTGWIYTSYTVVQYPKLPPGEYSFMVSARNSDGVWSKGYANVSFIIIPPMWARWWAKLLITLILVLMVYWRIRVILLREKIKAEAAQKLTEMQLRELREQLDPHFLFNNLNTLSYLVESKSPDAPAFVDELSKYFRYSLQSRNVEFTELTNELKQAERYLHLLRIRYGDKLVVKLEISDRMNDYFISNHSLQLLLENIIKHNVVSTESPLFIEIKTTERNTLIVKNNLQPKIGNVESTGLGLKSIDERYYLLFKRNIKITRTTDSFIVDLPLLTPDEYESIDY